MQDDTIDRIYEAAFVPDRWLDVFDRMAARAGGASGTLVIYAGDQLPSYRASPLIDDYVHKFVRQGAWKQSARALSVNTALGFEHSIRWISPDEFLPPELIEVDSAQQLLRARGMEAQVGTGVSLMTGEVAAFSVERWRDDGKFPEKSIAFLNGLRPHLARASLMAMRLGLERAQDAADILGKLGLAAATLTLRGRVLATNTLFDALPHLFIARGGGGVALSSKEADALLQDVIGEMSRDAHRTVRSIPIPAEEGRLPFVIHVLPLRRAAHDIFSGGDVLLAVTVAKANAKAPMLGILRGLFDLMPAEARLAAALASGSSLDEAAAKQGIRISSARTYLAQIFRKTGTHRQSELVALLNSTQPVRGNE